MPRVALLYDGLSVHKTKAVLKMLIDDFNWIPVNNIAYSPKMAWVECWFKDFKHQWRSQMARLLVLRQSENHSVREKLDRVQFTRSVISECQETISCSRYHAASEREMESQFGQ